MAAFSYDRHFISLWDVRTGKQVREIPTVGSGGLLAFSPDGKRFAAIGNTNCVGIWDVATGKDVFDLPGHQNAVRSLAFSPDGKMLASQGLDRTVRLWDVARGSQTHVLDAGLANDNRLFTGVGVGFSPDGSMVAAVGDRQDAKVRAWGTARGNLLAEWDVPSRWPLMAAFLPDNKTLAILEDRGIVSLRTLGTGKTVKSFAAGPDLPREMSGAYYDLIVSPDGRTLTTTQAASRLRVSDYTTGKLLLNIETPPGGGWDISYSSDGRILASGGVAGEGGPAPGSIFLWEAATGRPLGTIGDRKTGAVQRFAFSPDGRLMATGDEKENVVRLWNVFTGKEIAKFRGHSAPVTCLAFSPDGKRLASGSFDTTILLWDVSKLDRSMPEWRPAPKELDALAEKLQGNDGPAAFQAVEHLAAAGDAAVALLRPKLRPVAIPDQKRVARLLADLDDNAFDVREAAARELGTLGRQVEPDLRKALAGKSSAELRKRVETLLSAWASKPATAQEVKELRAVWVLEEAGTATARECLDELAKGAPGARLTQESQRALDRLQRRAIKR